MRAPVYRNAEVPQSVFGLAFPLEVGAVLLALWLFLLLLPPLYGAGLGLLTYGAVVGSRRGKAEGYWGQVLAYRVRQHAHGGFVSATARPTRSCSGRQP